MTDKEKLQYLSEILNKKVSVSEDRMRQSQKDGDQNIALIYIGEMAAFDDARKILEIIREME